MFMMFTSQQTCFFDLAYNHIPQSSAD